MIRRVRRVLNRARPGPRASPPAILNLRSPFLLLMLAHMPLAVLMDTVPPIAGLHALFTIGLGLKWALTGRDLERVAYLGAYIAGAEVLWRMTNSDLPWELGKYSISAIFLLAMVRTRTLKLPTAPTLYFVVLLPSAVISIFDLPTGTVRRELSFIMSGPLALMVCAWFYSRIRFSRDQIQRLLLSLVMPCLGTASIALFNILTNPNITWTTESNAELSGGFGPNQVAAALGLGVVMSFWAFLEERSSRGLRILIFAFMVFLAVQSVMTYSRGGMYSAVGAIAIGAPFLLADRRRAPRFLLLIAGAVVLGYVLLPQIDKLTQGTLLERFSQTDPTERDEIMAADLELWQSHPLFGVGPGRALTMRYRKVAAHTELSRLVAEHGTLGFLACVFLFVGGVQCVMAVKDPRDRAMAAGLFVFSILFMLTAAMRLAAPSFTFGLAFLKWPSHYETLAIAARARQRAAAGRGLPANPEESTA